MKALAQQQKKVAHSRRLRGMLVPEPKRGKTEEFCLQLVTADGREYRIVPDAMGKRLASLSWLNVVVDGQVFEFASGTQLVRVEHYQGDDESVLELENAEPDDDDWGTLKPEDMAADVSGFYA